MEQLKIGDILHCKNQGIISRLIRFFTSSEISHSALYLEIWGKPYVIDAQKDGVNVRPFEEWQKEYKYEILVTRFHKTIDEKELAIRALSMVGHTAYDFKGLLVKHPLNLITGKYKKEKDPADKMYCSEYVAWVHQLPLAYRMTPKDLFIECIQIGSKIVDLQKN